MPGKFYPNSIKSLIESIDFDNPYNEIKETKRFDNCFVLVNNEDYNNPNNVLKTVPSTAKHERIEGLIYGVFPTNNLNKQTGDFCFTLLNHPIDIIYDLFAYWNFTRKKTGPRTHEKILQAKAEALECIYSEEALAFKGSRGYSLKEYIYMVLDKKPVCFEYKGVKYEFMKEMFYGHENIKNFDYIGKYANIKTSFKSLSERLDFYIKPFDCNNPYSYKGEYYGKNLLKKLLKD